MTGAPMNIFVIIFLCLLLMVVSSKNAETIPPPNADIICPDGLSICPATSTCCISTDGDYSCCPIQDGVCCADHKHCCPKHYKCDLKIFKCDRVFSATMLDMEARLNKN
ncbi:unnamed protein product [Rotaria magnacalcarata]|uniref:Granulins domain-containing protein n=1 Tax=Rotaria magnacalcarata TaxID=392030 RepID=A0A819VTZ9_9BILA|nr:unnamed protein product [Rotaria magnacalcarata]CAF1512525.1 unnamed protein product [Rotaria magnacalcarata]CAF2051284.1 unnamed protein product [Rotaria magnacalcarata]CAF2077699.1 unnamed protein product [Rotaria magnacalcarata]CAF2173496.1 unnamed protein product [Rotaria magnacalcarata]